MASLTNFIVTNTLPLLLFFLGLFAGVGFASIFLSTRFRKKSSLLHLKQSELETINHHTREELATTVGQCKFLQSQLKNQSRLLSETRIQMGQEFENLANRIFDSKQEQFDTQNQKTLNYSLNPLRLQLDDFKKQVNDVYQKESAERNQLMGKVGELQSQTLKIGQEAVNLANALKGDNKAQGNWGEMILERILEDSGLRKGIEYDSQLALKEASTDFNGEKNARRKIPDVIINLPGDRHLIVDAKVSLVHYEQYNAAKDAELQALALKSHVQSIRSHVKSLSAKNYEDLLGINSFDLIFIFMPIEASFMLALQAEPQLFQDAYDKKVVLVSPTTLMTSLQIVSQLWRYEKQHKNAEKIAAEAGGLYDQFVLFAESIAEVGEQLDKTSKAYTLVKSRLYEGRGNLFKRAKNLRSLGAKTKRNLEKK